MYSLYTSQFFKAFSERKFGDIVSMVIYQPVDSSVEQSIQNSMAFIIWVGLKKRSVPEEIKNTHCVTHADYL